MKPNVESEFMMPNIDLPDETIVKSFGLVPLEFDEYEDITATLLMDRPI